MCSTAGGHEVRENRIEVGVALGIVGCPRWLVRFSRTIFNEVNEQGWAAVHQEAAREARLCFSGQRLQREFSGNFSIWEEDDSG